MALHPNFPESPYAIATGEVTHTTVLDTAGIAEYRSVIGCYAPVDGKGIDRSKPPVREWTYHPFQISPELLNEENTQDLPGCWTELALRRRLELIAQQFAKLAPITPVGGA